ncbi:hypothetical protein F485_gp047 [Aeromonas phage CC2]|uniref:Uncharacterized protein n=1 Tax=Aeromonas phage CC2 TaxID=1204516 RepID=I6WM29_9CAUD|nr:hypothetical protein F485_gp047 [Aeromonas phage CC2]AFN39278.1 hypothetical protein CC2_352 [Aeromonas phage CC2]
MIFIADIVDPSELGGATRTVIDTKFIKGLSEKNGVSYITFDVRGTDKQKTIAIHQDFEAIFSYMQFDERIKLSQ